MIDGVRLLGRPAVRFGAEVVEVPPSRAGAVWLYLARQGHWVGRDELLYLLWPDTPQDRAATTLRQHLQRLVRSPLGAALERERRRLRVQVPTDVAAFLAAAEEGRSDAALALDGRMPRSRWPCGRRSAWRPTLVSVRRSSATAWSGRTSGWAVR